MAFWAFIIILLLLRITWLFFTDIPLYADEAQYWFWSLTPDWGYYSKPPMIAWLITFTTKLFGNSEFAIRISSSIIHFLTAYVIYHITLYLRPNEVKQAKYAALTYFTLPAVFISSGIISTDPSLLLYWALTLLFFIKALNSNTVWNWLLMGLFFGLGMLSKYNMSIFALSAILYLSISHRFIGALKNYKIWLATLLALLIFSPNIWWNMQHHWVSINHTAELVNQNHSLFNRIDRALEFIIAQFGVMGPLLFTLMLISLGYINKQKLLACFTWPFLIIIICCALKSKAYANWAAPAYIAGVILVVFTAFDLNRIKWLKYSVILHCALGITIMIYQPICHYFNIPLTAKTDIFFRTRGAKELAQQVIHLHQQYPEATIAVAQRKPLALLHYYTRKQNINLEKWNYSSEITDHFALIAKPITTKHIILLTPSNEIPISDYKPELLNDIEVRIYDKIVFLQHVWLINRE